MKFPYLMMDDSTLEEMYLEDNFSTLQADVQKLKEENVIDENLICKIIQSKLEKIKLHSLPLSMYIRH